MPKCTKCSGREASKGHKWCSACKSTYEHERRLKERATLEQRGFLRGVEALRRAAVRSFEQVGSAELNGYTAVIILRELAVDDSLAAGFGHARL